MHSNLLIVTIQGFIALVTMAYFKIATIKESEAECVQIQPQRIIM